MKKKKVVDPIRQHQKNVGYRIGWVIAAVGIAFGFILLKINNG